MSSKDNLVYRAPVSKADLSIRRVYALPADLLKRVHDYGYENGHPSEVSAVRELLNAALKARSEGRT